MQVQVQVPQSPLGTHSAELYYRRHACAHDHDESVGENRMA